MMTEVKFKSFSSGSCGNCYFLGLYEDGEITASILIDAGVSYRRLRQYLKDEGIPEEKIAAILVTHDHNDHIRHLAAFCKYMHKNVYATSVLHGALAHHYVTKDHVPDYRKDLSDTGWTIIVPGKIEVRHFVVPHDATQTVGYAVVIGGHKFVIMTDIGEMTKEAMAYASNADTVVLESNYDMDMLMSGPYTHELKMRICKGCGHLSNDKCAQAIKSFFHPGLKQIFLCHLSENNNTPECAVRVSRAALEEIGAKAFPLRALPRTSPSNMFVL